MEMDIQPCKQIKEYSGKLYYHAPSQAWCLIKLKKELVRELGHLDQKRENFHYRMEFFESKEKFEKAIKNIIKHKKPIPIFLWFKKII